MTERQAPERPAIHVTRIVEENGKMIREPVSSEICDFCGDVAPAWDYDCAEFVIADLKFASTGQWASCQQCSEAIEDDDWEAIVRRATFELPNDLVTAAFRHSIPRIHAGFRVNRIGDRVRHTEG